MGRQTFTHPEAARIKAVKRRAAKALSRAEDESAISSGAVSRIEVNARNGLFSERKGVEVARAKIVSCRGRKL